MYKRIKTSIFIVISLCDIGCSKCESVKKCQQYYESELFKQDSFYMKELKANDSIYRYKIDSICKVFRISK